MFPSDLFDVGEELSSGQINCKLCTKRCVSWQGLLIHYKKIRGKKAASVQHHRAKPKEPEQKPLTLWDLKHGGKKLEP